MNKLLKDSLLPAIVTTVIAFAFNMFVAYFARTDLIIHVGEAVKVKEDYQVSVGFFNQGKKDIHKLNMILPVDIELSDINTSDPIMIRSLTGGGQNSFELGGISKSQKVQMTILFPEDVDPAKLNFLSSDISIGVKQFDGMEAPGTKELRSTLVQAVIYLIIFLGFNIYFKNQFLKLDKKALEHQTQASQQIEEFRNEIKQTSGMYEERIKILNSMQDIAEQQTSSLKKRLDEIESRVVKTRIIHARRIYEYKKELSYWRDTVRKIIYNAGMSEREANKMLEQISVNLKTHRTQKEEHDLESLIMLEEMYAYKNTEKSKE
ncbi:hypothetical protein [Paenibacillus illinoisensis]|uniref:hypothetical protein n=1 Tax=Paenibacillus illinoisensis TaxID=59845 RepID=UPI00301B942D